MEQSSLSKTEEKVLEFWRKEKVFEKLQEEKRDKKFVFYEGPPTANAGPAFHHVIARAFKDIIPRFKSLKGFSVLRKAGWDTHGLPVEIQIEKKIGAKTKSEIESFGVAKFNRLCQESVWEFKQLWDKFTERIGYWVDMKNPYVTYDTDYMESVWWILRKIWDKGLMEKDYKVVPYCARCGTPLSSHEVAMGYQDIEETSVYLKFRAINPEGLPFDFAQDKQENRQVYFLAWTTTPWTLPGNVALAVNPEIDYVFVETENKEVFVLAKNRLSILSGNNKILKEVKGLDLVGLKYEPLFDYLQKQAPKNIENAFQVYPAAFATDTDGTGIVHTAVMYGIEDFELGKQFSLPFFHTVDLQGRFIEAVLPWRGIWVKDADPMVGEELKKQGKLLKEEKITHTYPFCWRCDTPLLYYAHDSWFIRMTKVRDSLVANNEKIHWEPDHLKQGRFGEWLREVKDWALSRDRYWGTPLPIWVCEKDSSHMFVVGALKDFETNALAKNRYFLMRHGEADSNAREYHGDYAYDLKTPGHLTEPGKKQVEAAGQKLAKEKIELIISSDLVRTKETVEILKKHLVQAEVVFDERLREIAAGVLSGKSRREFDEFYSGDDWFAKKPESGESFLDVSSRSFNVFKELEAKYSGKNILIVSHNGVLWPMLAKASGQDIFAADVKDFGLAETKEFVSKNLPFNEKGEVDLHRPYVDEIYLKCEKCQSRMSRVKEVIDVWFDSGAMPLAQFHFPFEQKKPDEDAHQLDYQALIKKNYPYPADYISEAIDQTRGWFYTLLAISTLLELGPSYLNVVSVGHVVDAKGEKMSKSKGNIVDPWQMIEKYGADSLRWYFYTVNSPGEYKKFAEKDLAVAFQDLTTVLNVLRFFEFYVASDAAGAPQLKSANLEPNSLLDKWILARLGQVASNVDEFLSQEKIFEASRLIKEFIDDLSRWYLRRSRKRFQKPESPESLAKDSQFFAGLLMEFSKVLAPFTPFLAETVWQSVNSRLEQKLEPSVHMSSWPEIKPAANSQSLIEEMQKTREYAEIGLKLRALKSLGVKNCLYAFYVVSDKDLSLENKAVLADELNVEKIEILKSLPPEEDIFIDPETAKFALDLRVDEALTQKSHFRGIIRLVQDLRKESGLTPQDKIKLFLELPEAFGFLKNKEQELAKETGSSSVQFLKSEVEFEKQIEIEGNKIWAGIKK